MDLMIPFTLKSVLIAAATLGLLRLVRGRSAADRCSVASLGLGVLMVMPLAGMVLPPLQIAVPGFGAHPSTAYPTGSGVPVSGLDWWTVAYTLPLILLLSLTLLAIGRLHALRERAQVLVEPNWLAALARAQRRMAFRNGTALLTSNELSSPISWGVVRPVILLNEGALVAHNEAEAIIAHELAHVARLDWAKLLMARVVTALYWFNPLVWMLAREAHQLREEAADDAVLAANFTDTDYARLLISIARHECNGTLLGAHGVAPGRNSLARRVGRVLDTGSVRGPAARGFAAAIGCGAVALAAPLAALSFTSRPAVGTRTAPAPTARTVSIATRPDAVPAGSPTAILVAQDATQGAVAAGVVKPALDNADPHPSPDPKADEIVWEGDLAEGERAMAEDGVDDVAIVRAAMIGPLESNMLKQIHAVGVIGAYLIGESATGCRIDDFDQAVEIRTVGATPHFIRVMNLSVEWTVPPETRALHRHGGPMPGIESRSAPSPALNLTARHGLSRAVPISRSA